eukprot:TRINITY_DN12673_c0_g1_i1.p1 TRINITY_DN12673_c0_g1~~TRINITY_DN12673_c0_g1_i1.p1  ORF type:complete len:480 (+),score=159.69 TRINITY_DN12673_c0_g1_i1:48-1487(+)
MYSSQLLNHREDKILKEGDTVCLHMGYDNYIKRELTKGEQFGSRFGTYLDDDIIGKHVGEVIFAHRNLEKEKQRQKKNKKKKNRNSSSSTSDVKNYTHVVDPYHDILMKGGISHKTAIIRPLDISTICYHLELCPGKVVVESGTGTGCLSLAMAERLIHPIPEFSGKLHTFEFHEERSNAARQNFEDCKLDNVIEVTMRNVIEDGFGLQSCFADAVMLDLPSPYTVIEEVYNILKVNGKLCSYSVSIEQIQRTVEQLRKFGFMDIQVLENLQRKYDKINIESDEFTYNIELFRKKYVNPAVVSLLYPEDENEQENEQENLEKKLPQKRNFSNIKVEDNQEPPKKKQATEKTMNNNNNNDNNNNNNHDNDNDNDTSKIKCRYYNKGKCYKKENCPFLHELMTDEELEEDRFNIKSKRKKKKIEFIRNDKESRNLPYEILPDLSLEYLSKVSYEIKGKTLTGHTAYLVFATKPCHSNNQPN